MNWRDTFRTAARRGPHAPAALGADDARDPHRHQRRRPHRRARTGREGPGARPDQRARHEPARDLTRQLDEQHRRRGAASAPRRRSRVQDADALATRPRRPTSRPSRRCRPPRRPRQRLDELDHHAHRAPRRAGRSVRSRGVTSGRFISARDEQQRGRRSWSSAPTPRTSCSAAATPSARRPYNGVRLEVDRRARRRSAPPRTTSNNDLAVVPLSHLLAAARRRLQSQLGELDLREGDVGGQRCRPPTRRPNALLLNTPRHHDRPTPTSPSPPSSRSCPRRRRSTTRSRSCSAGSR